MHGEDSNDPDYSAEIMRILQLFPPFHNLPIITASLEVKENSVPINPAEESPPVKPVNESKEIIF